MDTEEKPTGPDAPKASAFPQALRTCRPSPLTVNPISSGKADRFHPPVRRTYRHSFATSHFDGGTRRRSFRARSQCRRAPIAILRRIIRWPISFGKAPTRPSGLRGASMQK